jgi:hypothetical protein
MNKLIIYAEPDNFILGLRAAKWLMLAGPKQRDGVVAYGPEPTIDFYVSRTKNGSIVARECRRA